MTIYVLNPLNEPVASGGVQKLHDHVEILNDAGLDACIVNPPAFSPWWFTTRARIVRPPVTLRPGDLLAIPEVYGDNMARIAPGVPRISVNQNAFFTFENVRDPARHPYLHCASLLGIMTMSQHDATYLTHTFPGVPVRRAFYRIDADMFGFAAGPRPKKIAYMPRKRKALAYQIVGSLHARGVLAGWDLQEIQGMTQAQVAEALATTRLFLSFSQREGFGLPPAEALARGCHVIGYAGWGGNEFFSGPNATLVLEDDLDGFIGAVADWLVGPGWDEERSRSGSDAILRTYSKETERDSVLAAYAALQARYPAGSTATGTITLQELAVPYRSPLRRLAGRVKAKLEHLAGL
ncbi:glycosyltransferase [Rhodopila sp.]|jgi:hypothetical protein|uniref:glycosyltransferase n=1 Tax=Rhodopila sp. TaxID=2480087 RepID=UPI002C8D8C33|nr:glycosyltransferase [Rhodopila sp.]HVZ07712.1 glycosyltransferase [Rhodopila sp.]